jgi:hypothetical protein
MNNNHRIDIPAPVLALLEVLLSALKMANALDTPFAVETDGTYGKIKDALLHALAEALDHHTTIPFGTCTEIAYLLYWESIDNWEDIAYQIDLWNKDIISL